MGHFAFFTVSKQSVLSLMTVPASVSLASLSSSLFFFFYSNSQPLLLLLLLPVFSGPFTSWQVNTQFEKGPQESEGLPALEEKSK